MNKRLRELMIEAGYVAPELAGRAIKLSELIVEDCLKQIRNYDLPDFMVDNIKQHFGTE